MKYHKWTKNKCSRWMFQCSFRTGICRTALSLRASFSVLDWIWSLMSNSIHWWHGMLQDACDKLLWSLWCMELWVSLVPIGLTFRRTGLSAWTATHISGCAHKRAGRPRPTTACHWASQRCAFTQRNWCWFLCCQCWFCWQKGNNHYKMAC